MSGCKTHGDEIFKAEVTETVRKWSFIRYSMNSSFITEKVKQTKKSQDCVLQFQSLVELKRCFVQLILLSCTAVTH